MPLHTAPTSTPRRLTSPTSTRSTIASRFHRSNFALTFSSMRIYSSLRSVKPLATSTLRRRVRREESYSRFPQTARCSSEMARSMCPTTTHFASTYCKLTMITSYVATLVSAKRHSSSRERSTGHASAATSHATSVPATHALVRRPLNTSPSACSSPYR